MVLLSAPGSRGSLDPRDQKACPCVGARCRLPFPGLRRPRRRSQTMLATLSATDIAFAMNAVMQGVFCVVWLLGSWVIGDVRRAALHWSTFSGLSTLSFLALVAALHHPTPL